MPKRKNTLETKCTVKLSGSLATKFRAESKLASMSEGQYAELLVDNAIVVDSELNHQRRQLGVNKLAKLVESLPAVRGRVAKSKSDEYFWWLKFSIDLQHPLVWHVLQRLGHVLNYVSLDQRFDIAFVPVSPPPELNGGPEYLSWVIEAKKRFVNPKTIYDELRAQLPKNLRSEREWKKYDSEK